MLASKGADYNAVVGPMRHTPLMQACIGGYLEVVKQLVRCKYISLNAQVYPPLFFSFSFVDLLLGDAVRDDSIVLCNGRRTWGDSKRVARVQRRPQCEDMGMVHSPPDSFCKRILLSISSLLVTSCHFFLFVVMT